MKCHGCNKVLEIEFFTNSQIKKTASSRKCKSCCPNPTSAQNQLHKNVIYQPIIPTQSFSFTQLISANEIDQLIKENNELKKRIAIYEGNFATLNADINAKNLEIEILKRENQELRERVKSLEDAIKSHGNTIKTHESDIRELKINKALESYIIAIQDLNRKEGLEKKLKAPVDVEMFRLRKIRLLQCHFIDDNDNEKAVLFKFRSIYTHLKSMSTELKNELESKVCKDNKNHVFVDSIIKYLEELPNFKSFESSHDIEDSLLSEIEAFWS